MSKHKDLVTCLLNLDPHYQPKQPESILTLLNNLKELANIYLNCLTSNEATKE